MFFRICYTSTAYILPVRSRRDTYERMVIYMERTAGRESRKAMSGLSGRILKAFILGGIAFTVCITVFPFLLLKVSTPEDFISVCAVSTVAATAFFASLAAGSGISRGFIATGIVTALVIILLLICASLIFESGESEKNYMFSGILYAVSLVFSLLGAGIHSRKKSAKKRRRKR